MKKYRRYAILIVFLIVAVLTISQIKNYYTSPPWNDAGWKRKLQHDLPSGTPKTQIILCLKYNRMSYGYNMVVRDKTKEESRDPEDIAASKDGQSYFLINVPETRFLIGGGGSFIAIYCDKELKVCGYHIRSYSNGF